MGQKTNSMTHWRKQFFDKDNKNLGHWDLEKDGKYVPVIVTIERFVKTEIATTAGKEGREAVKLKEFAKPMVMNVSNFKRLENKFQSTNPDDYIGKQVILGVEKVSSPEGKVDALRFSSRPIPEKKLETMTKDEFDKMLLSVKEKKTTIAILQTKRIIPKEFLDELLKAEADAGKDK